MPNFVRSSRKQFSANSAAEENAALDACDRRILSALATNGRISYRDLGEIAHLSANATAERVHRLQTLGVIRGFTADVSPASLGLHLQAYVDLKLQPGTSMAVFEKRLRKIDGVREAFALTGAFDVRLRVDCRDPMQLGRFIEQLRAAGGIQETCSSVISQELQIIS